MIAHSVEIESPPPRLGGGIAIVATSLEALTELDRGLLSEGIGRRACVVLTDGESQSFTQAPEGRTCAFLFIRVGGADERIFGEEGSRIPDARFPSDADYRPDLSAGATLERAPRPAAACGRSRSSTTPRMRFARPSTRGRRRAFAPPPSRSPLRRPRRSRACPDGRARDRGGATTSGTFGRAEGRPVPLSR